MAVIEATRELWLYRELFYFMVWREVKVRYKQSILGAAWAVVQPLITMLVFTLVFHKMAKIESEPNVPYEIFSYTALLPWTYFRGAITQIGTSMVTNKHLITKVYFPRVTIPAAHALRGMLDFSIAFVILLGIMAWYGFTPPWTLVLWPVLLIPLAAVTLGIGMIFASLNVRYRDVQHVLPFVVQLWLFMTPVIYPSSIFPEKWRWLLALNPMTGIIEAFRASALPQRPLDAHSFLLSMAITVLIFIGGGWYFHRTARSFADIV
jgi:lipopolysaccharide transport system permease protein